VLISCHATNAGIRLGAWLRPQADIMITYTDTMEAGAVTAPLDLLLTDATSAHCAGQTRPGR
jgi:hypothetical protein